MAECEGKGGRVNPNAIFGDPVRDPHHPQVAITDRRKSNSGTMQTMPGFKKLLANCGSPDARRAPWRPNANAFDTQSHGK